MARRRAQQSKSELDWRSVLSDPKFREVVQQALAVILFVVGAITLPAHAGLIGGNLIKGWANLLRYLFGWGIIPLAVAVAAAGVLWLAHQLDHPLKIRWRPLVGMELAFFGLLTLTHAVAGKDDAWGLVTRGQDGSLFCQGSGGLIGWAISALLVRYIGTVLTVLVLLLLLSLGLGLAFDVTLADVKYAVSVVRESFSRQEGRGRTRRAEKRGRPRVSQPARPAPSVRPRPASAGESAPQQVAPPARPQPSWDFPRITPTPAAAQPAAAQAPVAPATFPQNLELPSIDLLNESKGPALTDEEVREKSRIIEETLGQFGLPVEVTEVRVGPTVTQFGVSPGFVERGGGDQRRRHKVRVNQISTLADDLALALAAPRLRVEAPVPGRSIVGIEVPNSKVQLVGVREVLDTEDFRELGSPLAIVMGRDVAGEPVVADLTRMPHLLIAGTTGSGKSVCIKAIVTCLAYNNTPTDLRMVMIDPKMVELVRFNGLPHLYGRVEVDLERVVKVLRWVALEMDDRYKLFAAASARHLDDYNRMMKRQGEPIKPRIVVLVDELADLMMLAPEEVEKTICRIAQMARATGIHLVMATQRPSVDVVTGLIKANFPARISFATVSQTDSRVILDMPGAETLLGNGDMLYLAADAGYPVRVQGCFVSEEEVERVVSFWHEQVGFVEGEAPWERMMRPGEGSSAVEDEYGVDEDMLQKAVELVQRTGSASASLLQRRLRIGHPRAARLMKVMEEMGVVGPQEAAGRTRRVIGGDE
jgi:S-DNA-T family DNA segregation ATPase FtsK/SpoIIIE